MKKIILIILLLFTAINLFSQDFTVEKYICEINVSNEGWFDITENYDINFTAPKHGITRDILTTYDFQDINNVLSKRKISFSNVETPGHKFVRSPEFTEKFSGMMNLKIGDPNRLVTGLQHYEIKYRVNDALIKEDSVFQLYWNIKPNGWTADFKKIEFKINLPEGFNVSAENSFTYAGGNHSDTVSNDFEYFFNDNHYSGISREGYISLPGESVTVLIKIPSELFKSNATLLVKKNLIWPGILVALFGVFGLFWLRFGRDDKVIPVTSYYPPLGIDPALAGYLMDDGYNSNQLISFIPKWGAEGLLKIKEIQKESRLTPNDFELTKLAELPAGRPDYEQTIFRGIFEGSGFTVNLSEILKSQGLDQLSEMIDLNKVNIESSAKPIKISSLRNVFYLTMNKAQQQLSDKGMSFYKISGEKAMLISVGICILLTLALPAFMLYKFGFIAAISAFVACLILVWLSFTMRKKNLKGNSVYAELLGFYNFVKLADSERIKTLINDDPAYFEKTMSYALSFGMLEKWATNFDGLLSQPPKFYSHSNSIKNNHSFSMNNFGKSFGSSMRAAGATMVSSPSRSGSSGSSSHSSSGGGRSGGGFGGGGGGSW